MKTGLILLIVGHLNFITGALVHGTVLRFVVTARDATSLHYGVTNSASVLAALLVPLGAELGTRGGGMWGGVGMREGWVGDAGWEGVGMQDGRCSVSPSLLQTSLSSANPGN